MTADGFVETLSSEANKPGGVKELLSRQPQVVIVVSRAPRTNGTDRFSWNDLDEFLCEHATTILRDHGEGRSYEDDPGSEPYRLDLRHLVENYPAGTRRAEAFKLAARGTESRRVLCRATWGSGWADMLSAKAESYAEEIPPLLVRPEQEILWRQNRLRLAAQLPAPPDSNLFSWPLAQRVRSTQPVGEQAADL